MGYALQVFVSSTCHELRDLRASIKSWLTSHGLVPLMSDEGGFPHVDGMPPYATCLRALEQCPLVICVIDRQYGHAFDDWGPYTQYQGCAPTHAELRHALELEKRVLIFVHADTWNFHETWRKNPDAFKTSAPHGLDEATLRMFQEVKQRKPAPWIERFADVSDVLRSLNSEFVNQLYLQLDEREKETTDLAGYVLDKLLEASPEVRQKVLAGLSPALLVNQEELKQKLIAIEDELRNTRGSTKEKLDSLEREKGNVEARLESVTQQLRHASLLLARAAMKDVPWLDFIRRTMMPKQPGRIPFHNSAEVALRGYHAAAGGGQTPVLKEVTWCKLPHEEAGLHRGYRAGIIFRGGGFVPGITFACRRRGEGLSIERADYSWRLPNTYFGDYLEVSSSDDEIEGPLSWRDFEFQVKNPEGQTSDWVLFTYPFDEKLLNDLRLKAFAEGSGFLATGRAAEAIEPLRKAYVFADRVLGGQNDETLKAKALWEQARSDAALAKLRFRTGDELRVASGPHAGKTGVVEQLYLNHVDAYLIRPADGELFQASDEQVESAPPSASQDQMGTEGI